ncbi:hypothetical protein J4Y29_25435, partial [Escherichia coli]
FFGKGYSLFETRILFAGFSCFLLMNMVYDYGVSVAGGNLALWAGQQHIKNVIARHCELTKFDSWYKCREIIS